MFSSNTVDNDPTSSTNIQQDCDNILQQSCSMSESNKDEFRLAC
jgi:hypothetical protein